MVGRVLNPVPPVGSQVLMTKTRSSWRAPGGSTTNAAASMESSARAHEQRLAVVGTPVVVTAHGARLEMDFPHSAWGNFEGARGIGSSSRIGHGRRRQGRRARAKTVNVNRVVQQVADAG